ncbi:calcium-binding protein [Symbioplanes lichenis]|uniref:calcium-binding protein n=1 Tax=Symbioplanes lichenis TaxID=1629072 RepID=UPI00273965FB|nr:calcium-binding protein [Actinoplanes lichenis]
MNLSKRTMLAAVAVPAATMVATTAFLAAPASAATTGQAQVIGTVVKFTAAAGQANSLVVTVSGRTVTLDDKVAVKAGKGCQAVKGDKTKVKCTTAKKTTQVTVLLGDKNDFLWNKTSVPMKAWGSTGNDQLIAGTGGDWIDGGSGNDNLLGGAGKDRLYGLAGNDGINGGGGNDTVYAGAGNDSVSGSGGADTLHGGAGNDSIVGGELDGDVPDGADTIYGTEGDDYLLGGDGNDRITGGAGNDVVKGEKGDDYLVGEYSPGSGSATARDRLDGGKHVKGDACYVRAAGTKVNCEK